MTLNQNTTPEKRVHLRWTGNGMEYVGAGGVGPSVTIDAKSEKGPGPMDTLLLAVAGCMAVDVQSILEKSRVPLTGLEVEVVGERYPTHPKRYTGIRLAYRLEGPEEEHQAKMERAVSLSREKFCSVLHSLHPDIAIEIEINRV